MGFMETFMRTPIGLSKTIPTVISVCETWSDEYYIVFGSI